MSGLHEESDKGGYVVWLRTCMFEMRNMIPPTPTIGRAG